MQASLTHDARHLPPLRVTGPEWVGGRPLSWLEERRRPGRVDPLRLAPVSRAALAWHNRIARSSQPLPFELDGQSYCLQWVPWLQPSKLDIRFAVQLTVDGCHPGWLLLNTFPLQERLEHYLPPAALGELPAELRRAVVEAALAPLLDKAEQSLGVALQVAEVATRPPPVSGEAGIGFTLKAIDRISVTGVLVCAAAWLPRVEEMLAHWPKPPQERWDWLRTVLRCEIGAGRLTAAELARLTPGDVILAERCSFPEDGAVWVCIASQSLLRAQLVEANKIIIEQEETVTTETNDNLITLDELAVPLSFDIGELTIAYRELRQLQPGYTFELERTPERLVTIRSRGQRIGTGELVQVDGRVGVRVLELAEQGDG